MSAGVPTVWQGLLTFMEANNLKFSTMNRTVIGGSACAPAMIKLFQDKYGVAVLHAWGMTEMSPLGTACTFKQKHTDMSAEQRLPVQYKQGRVLFGVDMKVVDGDGKDLPWDGVAFGDLLVRGPWVVRDYYNSGEPAPLLKDARTELVSDGESRLDSDGYMQITDAQDVTSRRRVDQPIELENIAGIPRSRCGGCGKSPEVDERPLWCRQEPTRTLRATAMSTSGQGRQCRCPLTWRLSKLSRLALPAKF